MKQSKERSLYFYMELLVYKSQHCLYFSFLEESLSFLLFFILPNFGWINRAELLQSLISSTQQLAFLAYLHRINNSAKSNYNCIAQI